MKRSVLIEFVGLPGAGKTSVVNGVLEKNNSLISIKKDREEYKKSYHETVKRHADAFGFFLKHPKLSLQLFNLIKKSNQISIQDFRATYINLLYKISFYKKLDAQRSNVLDEGILHAFMSIIISAKNRNFLSKIKWNKIKFPFQIENWTVVYIDNPEHVILERLQKRSNQTGEIHRILKKNLQNELIDIQLAFDELLNSFRKHYSVEVQVVQNKILEDTIDEVIQNLNKCFHEV